MIAAGIMSGPITSGSCGVRLSRRIARWSPSALPRNGQVENVERFGLEDGQVVALNRRVTTSNTRGVGFLRQLFSNIGNIGAGQFLEEG